MFWKKMKLLVAASIPFAVSCAPMITFQHPALATQVPAEWEKDEAVVILSDSVMLDMQEEGGKNVLYETDVTWYKFFNTSSDLARKIYIFENPFLEQKPSIAVSALYNDRTIKNHLEVNRWDSLYYPYSLKAHYSGDILNFVDIPDYSKIKFLRVSVKSRYTRPPFYSANLFRSGEYNIVAKTITFSYPSDSIKQGIVNREGIVITDIGDDKQSLNLIKMENSDKIKFPESWFAGFYASFPPKGMTSYSWRELGDYLLAMIADSVKQDSLVFLDSIAIRIIINNRQSEDSIINTVFNFVKDHIRYYGSWEKAYGWIPRNPKAVFTRGYGDCKEMATFLTHLLRKAGVAAYQTLVNTEGFQFLAEYPTLGEFDHMIACVDKKNGERIFLDATNKSSTWKTSYYWVLGQKVLILKDGASVIDTIKPDVDYCNKIKTVSQLLPSGRSGKNNDWVLHGIVDLNGALADGIFWTLESAATYGKEQVLRTWLKDALRLDIQEVKLLKAAPQSVTVSYIANFDQCLLSSPEKGIVFTMPDIYTPQYDFCDLSYPGDRYLSAVEQTDTWILPETYGRLDTTSLTNKYGNGTWTDSSNTITRTYRCGFASIPAGSRDTLKQFFRERSRFARGTVWAK